MQAKAVEYKIIKGSAGEEELENYRLCFEENGTDRDMKNLQWLHHENLVHDNVIYYAFSAEKIAAIYTALPVIFRINNSLLPALQSIDTLTDIDHRGKGLFIKLASQLYNDAAANNFALIYGFPNDNSAPGFFNKLQWQSFGEVPFLIKPLNPLYFFKKLIKRKKHTDFSSTNYIFNAQETYPVNDKTEIKAIDIFDTIYDRLWLRVAENIQVCVERSAAYMNWRYVDKPGEHYYRYGLYIDNKLTGIIVFSIKNKHDGLIGYVMEFIFEPTNVAAGKRLLKFATKLFKQNNTDVVLAWSLPGTFNHSCYKNSGYYKLPEKLRPQKLFLGAKVFRPENAGLINNIKNWYISYSDSDTA